MSFYIDKNTTFLLNKGVLLSELFLNFWAVKFRRTRVKVCGTKSFTPVILEYNHSMHISHILWFGLSDVIVFLDAVWKVWEEASGESLLQIQLLIALRNFVVELGYQSPTCYNVLLPILHGGIDINSPDILNLLEDGMLVSFPCLIFIYCLSLPYAAFSS